MQTLRKLVKSKPLRVTVLLLPLMLGMVAYMVYYRRDVLYSLYSSLRLYLFITDATPFQTASLVEKGLLTYTQSTVMRIFLECARWLGGCVTVTFVTQLFRQLFRGLFIGIKARKANSVTIHGTASCKNHLAKSLGSRAITDDADEAFQAKRQIIAFENDSDTFRFLNDHFEALIGENRDHTVYLCTLSHNRTSYRDRGCILSNSAENCARMYWNQLYLRRYGEHPEQVIVIIGFGRFGQALFQQAVLTNVFLDATALEYHVFGDSAAFVALHQGLSQFMAVNAKTPGLDSVHFHADPWPAQLELLTRADRVILAEDDDEKNIGILCSLNASTTVGRVHLRTSDARIVEAFWPDKKISQDDITADICVFGTDAALYNKEIILDEKLSIHAKCIFAKYRLRTHAADCIACKQHGGIPACAHHCEPLQAAWDSMNYYQQSANITQADHLPVKVRALLRRDCMATPETREPFAAAYQAMRADGNLDALCELEHRRWMRNLFFSGWAYGPERKNPLRIHNLLLPYDELPAGEKLKDQDAYDVIDELLTPSTYENFPKPARSHRLRRQTRKG